ncbi:MAG TPA: hypothetical protein VNM14_06725 [Planctomycetota bacterium]|nr:hypothetical protein [Planctomycetota bacterium]
MRRLLGPLLLAAIGCSGFARPTPEQLRLLTPPEEPPTPVLERLRVHVSLDSAWLAGEFDGVVVAMRGPEGPLVRVQLFGDLGPKMLDLLARPERIVGFFPQTSEGIDCALPDEASPHLLLFMGASLLERYSRRTPARILGVREEPEGWLVKLRPAVRGTEVHEFRDRNGRTTKRRIWWMYGLSWDEERPDSDDLRISATKLSLRVRILERSVDAALKPGSLDLILPAGVRLTQGSRK